MSASNSAGSSSATVGKGLSFSISSAGMPYSCSHPRGIGLLTRLAAYVCAVWKGL